MNGKIKRQILISLLILLSIQALAGATVRPVPHQYPTIQSAINASSDGDIVVVAPGVYSGFGNRDLDFGQGLPAGQTRAITVQSQINPADPNSDKIASTIIDCQGSRYNPHRAFWFHKGEDPNSKVLGFTIRNAYWVQTIGSTGTFGYDGDNLGHDFTDFDPVSTDPLAEPNELPPRALNGADANGDSYGGAIYCQPGGSPVTGSSPTIKYCVITDCTVTGAQGGDGAIGQSGPWLHWTLANEDPCNPNHADPNLPQTLNLAGQWGGHGGFGDGNSYGGAIACVGGSSPVISDCTISNNLARGGCGGDGGRGGSAQQQNPPAYDGEESGGGDGGLSIGGGNGGAIYCDSTSSPIIENCTFINNIALTGARAAGGQRGFGTPSDPRATDGLDGFILPPLDRRIVGGAVYFKTGSQANFTNCTFTGNKAYEAYTYYDPYVTAEDISAYTLGGALYSDANNPITLSNCEFMDNLGGAIYCDSNCTVNINNTYDPSRNCLFAGNSDIHDSTDEDYLLTLIGYPSRHDPGSGGAIYVGSNGSLDIQNCVFGGNLAKNDGGALKCKSSAALTNCLFSSNVALGETAGYGYGGAVDAHEGSGTVLVVDFNNCGFTENQAICGGGLSSQDFDADLINCYFIDNTAEEGGGLYLVNGDLLVAGGTVKGNNATDGYGGGLMCSVAKTEINNCAIMDNFAAGNGGAISFYIGDSPQVVKNCLITGNTSAVYGGGISCEFWASPEIKNCTFSDNFADSIGGAVFVDWGSSSQLTDCIFEGCNNHAIHEESGGGNASVTYSLFYNNPDGDYYDSGTGLTYTGAGDIGSIPGGSNNLYGNPLFVSGSFGDYYLSQTAAGQGSNSPAVDSGSATAVALGLDTFTTRTDNVADSGQVDRGYHYPDVAGVGVFQLTTSVVGGHGAIEPASNTYYAGAVVTLTAKPDAGWRLELWSGTDDDSSTDLTNTVVMNSDRAVTVSFEQGQTLTVGVDGDFPTIEAALLAAVDGDTIVVFPGTWYGPQVAVNKSVIIRSVDPNDPEATIIDGTEYVDRAFIFGPDTDSGTILDGFTIQNHQWQPGQAQDPEPCPGLNGVDGGGAEGGAIYIVAGASPVIRNCIIRESRMRGGDASDGCAAADTANAGRGGWGGWAWGGGIYCGPNSTPAFVNCQIVNNHAGGGNGGDGGDNGAVTNGWPNYGGNWSESGKPGAPAYNIDPSIFTPIGQLPEPVYGPLWAVWQAYPWIDNYGNFRDDYIGDYRWYSAYGGGVFCDANSTVTFTDCTISGNRTSGGMSGEGGLFYYQEEPDNELEPEISYQPPSFGGGVYCAAGSAITFTHCTITDNVSVRPDADLDAYFDPDPDVPRAYYHLDPYTGHGGGVCAERTAAVTFTDCTVSGNEASVGGGVYWKDASAKLIDSDITLNRAYDGGGLFGKGGPATVIGCNISGNEAFGDVTDPNGEGLDPNVYDPNSNYYLPGSGGGVHCDSASVQITDSNVSSNTAGASGGGVYLTGPNSPVLTNCLLAANTAGKNGGGVSASILSQLTISVSTIAGNMVSGNDFPTMLGGGLYCSDGANTNINKSILWANYSAGPGDQIAINQITEPAAVSVSYSDVQDGAAWVFVASGCSLLWDDVNNLTGTVGDPDSEPLFVTGRQGSHYLSQPDANVNQTELSPCVDAGGENALDLDLYRHTTRTDELLDAVVGTGIVDMGYHYILTTDLIGDFDFGGKVNISDLGIFNQHWMSTGCQFPDWCHGTDLNQDGRVNSIDYAIFAANYIATETTAPEPDPMTWAVPPVSAGPTSITMTATTATDNSGTTIEYYFDCVYGGGHNRTWDHNSAYTDTGLATDNKYGYRVKARDTSDNLNETGWSFIGYAIAGQEPPLPDDHNAPMPNPMTWATVPYATSSTSIKMVATTATDDTAGVQYYFENSDANIVNSGWQGSPTWEDANCAPETTYNYRVKARDTSINLNQTEWSVIGSATTPATGQDPNDPNEPNEPNEPPPPDTIPPLPNPSQWADGGEPSQYYAAGGYWHTMTAEPTSDATTGGSEPVQYYFDLVKGGYGPHDSGWQTSNVYNYQVSGGTPQYGFYRVKTKDAAGNETGWSTTLEAQ